MHWPSSVLAANIFAASMLLITSPTFACANFGRDEGAVAKVQSTWTASDQAYLSNAFALSMTGVRKTLPYVQDIHNHLTRDCVEDGALSRIGSDEAAMAYLAHHSGDVAGAQASGNRFSRNFHYRHPCP